MMKLLTKLWILTASGIITFYYSFLSVTLFFSRKTKRERGDRILRAWSRALLGVIHVKYKILNPHRVQFEPNKAYIVMCNHTSLYDIPLSMLAIDGSMRMIAKKELSKIPLFGHGMKCAEFVFIDRKNREQAIKDLELAAKLMKTGLIIWVSPEGTRSSTGELLEFKKGGFLLAIETGATIIPLGIRGALKIVRNKSVDVNLGKTVEMHLGKPIDASQYTIAQRNVLMQDVRTELSRAAGLSK